MKKTLGNVTYGMMETGAFSNYWDYFDKIFCITLAERPDRQESAKIQFDKVGLAGKVEFLIVNRHPRNCEQGIYESHLICIEKGLQAGAGHIVIFEDDILFDRFSSTRLKTCVDFLSRHVDWNVLFFGCLVSGSARTWNKSILKVRYRSLSHAYVLNRKFAEVLVKRPWQGMAYDEFLDSFNQEFYAIYPSFAFQSDSPSDNRKYLQLDKFRRFCGGLQRIQKGNEWVFHHIRVIIAFHMLLAVLVALWIFK